MTVGELLDLLFDVRRFRLVSIKHTGKSFDTAGDILYEGWAFKSSTDPSILSVPVYYFGIADKDTIEFYVEESDIY